MSDDRRDDIESGDTGATGRAPRPEPTADREFDELDQSFADLPSKDAPAFFEETIFDDGPATPAHTAPVEDFGFDDIAQGDEPVPGSRRSSRRGGLRGSVREPAPRGGGGGGARPRRRSGGGGSGGGGGRPRRPASPRGGGSPLMANPAARMGVFALVGLVVILALFFWWRDFSRGRTEDSYKSYINEAGQIVDDSSAQGKALIPLLQNTSGRNASALQTEVQKLATQAAELTKRAEALTPPDGLIDADRQLQTVMRMRANGLSFLAQTIPNVMKAENAKSASRQLADPMKRLLASDVLYDDQFVEVASATIREQDIQGLEVASTPFLTGTNDKYASDAGAAELLSAMKKGKATTGANPGGALRGTSVESVIAQPSGTTLSLDNTNTIPAADNLEWQVVVKNGGGFEEENVVLSAQLVYPDSPDPVDTQEFTIKTFPANTEQTITLKGPPATAWSNGKEGVLIIESAPVSGESKTDNNRREFALTITVG